MGTIKLKNIQTYSITVANRRRQDWFRLFSRPRNKTDLRKSCLSDDLNDTVDYVLLNSGRRNGNSLPFTRTCSTKDNYKGI
jgi:dihydroneopterin aldolase